jgi:hypothetical protein
MLSQLITSDSGSYLPAILPHPLNNLKFISKSVIPLVAPHSLTHSISQLKLNLVASALELENLLVVHQSRLHHNGGSSELSKSALEEREKQFCAIALCPITFVKSKVLQKLRYYFYNSTVQCNFNCNIFSR